MRVGPLAVLLVLAGLAAGSPRARAGDEARRPETGTPAPAGNGGAPEPGNLPPGRQPAQGFPSGPVSAPVHEPRPPASEPRRPPPPPREALCLIADYLPPFVYVDTRTGRTEQLACSFRVEKHPALEEQPEFTVRWRLLDGAGRELAKGEEPGAARERFAIVRAFIDLPDAARRLEFTLQSGGLELGSGRAEIVGEDDPWPAGAAAALTGMVGAGGERLILRLPERVAEVDERWKPIKAVFSRSRPRPERVVVVGPRMAGEGERSYLEVLGGPKDARLQALDLFAPPPAGEAPAAPAGRAPAAAVPASGATRGIFALVEAVETRVTAAAKGADLVVLVMPQSDPEMGTDRRAYRQGLDWAVSRLLRAGAKGVAVVPPLSRSVSDKQLAAYAAACADSARVYGERGAALVKSESLLADKYWTPKGATGRVTGRFPNEAGQEALAELIRGACR